MAQAQSVSFSRRSVVAQTRLCRIGRRRRDRIALGGRAAEGGWGSGAVLRTPSALGRHVASLELADARDTLIRLLSQTLCRGRHHSFFHGVAELRDESKSFG